MMLRSLFRTKRILFAYKYIHRLIKVKPRIRFNLASAVTLLGTFLAIAKVLIKLKVIYIFVTVDVNQNWYRSSCALLTFEKLTFKNLDKNPKTNVPQRYKRLICI